MTRSLKIVVALVALCLTAGAASAQHCKGVKVQAAQTYTYPTHAAPTYYPPTYQTNTYTYLPVAVYAVPGNPTVALNVYPGTTVLLQQPTVNVTVNVDGKKVEVQTEQKK